MYLFQMYFLGFQIFYYLATSIAAPLLLSSLLFLRKGLNVPLNLTGIFQWLVMLCLVPLYPTIFLMYELTLTEISKAFSVSVDLLEDAKYHASHIIQIDVGLESHLQLMMLCILLLINTSRTKTIVRILCFLTYIFFQRQLQARIMLSNF